jgi:hypothetical protein
MPDNDSALEQCVETLCRAGCSVVRGYLGQLGRGEVFPAVAHLSASDCSRIHAQLQSIMNVYAGRAGND